MKTINITLFGKRRTGWREIGKDREIKNYPDVIKNTFFSRFSFIFIDFQYKEDHALVMVILCDFKLRKFQMRTPLPNEELDPELTEIEQMLYGCKTKLNAALARSRIKACVISIDHLLPESVRKNDKLGANMSIFCWVNLIKTRYCI